MEYKLKYVGSNLRTDWSIYNNATMETISKHDFYSQTGLHHFDPIDERLFNLDIFTFTDKVNILHSSMRKIPNIPCILHNNIARPDDIRLPEFIISDGTSHSKEYIIICYQEWNDELPTAHIVKRIGSVDDIRHYYEYYLYSKSLHYYEIRENEYLFSHILSVKSYKIENRLNEHIITIDPKNSKDYDDGIGFQKLSENTSKLTIYISNVALWIDYLNLWEAVSYRMLHIHLPDRKRPLIPFVLSDGLFSLKAGHKRIALAMDLYITDGEIKSSVYRNVIICPFKNYSYNEEALNTDKIYSDVFKLTTSLFRKRTFKNIDYMRDSHDMICYLMLLSNTTIAKEYIKYECGLFRSENPIPCMTTLGEKMREHSFKFKKLIYNWQLAGSCFRPYKERVKHSLLKLEEYIQTTSPIRRLVDFLNSIIFQMCSRWIKRNFINEAFIQHWISKTEYINLTLRSSRRVPTNVSTIGRFKENPKKEYNGCIFDIITRNDGLHQYMVYIEELNVITRYLSNIKRDEFDKDVFRLYICKHREREKLMVTEWHKI
jgi:hypothetical protein